MLRAMLTLLLPPTYAAAFFARFVSASYSPASRFAAEAFTRSNLDLGGVMALGLLEGMLTHSQELSVGLSTMIAI